MDTIQTRLAAIQARIDNAATASGRSPDDITLLAVSKRQPDELVAALIAAGHEALGENLVQPWAERSTQFAQAQWHLIGPVQSKKAAAVWRGRPALLHTVDRPKLVEALDRRHELEPAAPIAVLIQVNVDAEPQKAGVSLEGLDAMVDRVTASPAMTLRGLMCIPRPMAEGGPPLAAFAALRTAAERVSGRLPSRYHLSMGMSSDFEAAIAEGATIVRVGTALFGRRDG